MQQAHFWIFLQLESSHVQPRKMKSSVYLPRTGSAVMPRSNICLAVSQIQVIATAVRGQSVIPQLTKEKLLKVYKIIFQILFYRLQMKSCDRRINFKILL